MAFFETVKHRQSGSASAAAATSASPTVPARACVGDLLVLAFSIKTATAQTFTVPAGWTQRVNLSVNAPVVAVYTKVCVAADIGASVAVSWTTSAIYSVEISAISGVDTDNPFESIVSGNGAASTTVNYGTAQVGLPGCAILMVAGWDTGAATTSSFPTSFQTGVNLAAGTTASGLLVGTTSTIVAAGMRDPGSWTPTTTNGSSTNSQGVQIVLRPAWAGRIRTATSNSTTTGAAFHLAFAMSASGYQPGDFCLVIVHWNSATVTTTDTGIDGWTLVESVVDSTGGQSMKVYAKQLVANDVFPTITFSGSCTATFVEAVYAGVSEITAHASQINAAATTILSPSITQKYPNELLACIVGAPLASGVINDPVGMGSNQANRNIAGSAINCSVEPCEVANTTTARAATLSGTAVRSISVALSMRTSAVPVKMRSLGLTTSATGTSFAANAPQEASSKDDTLIAVLRSDDAADTVTAVPTGWTLVAQTTTNAPLAWVYKKTATASEPATYTFTFSSSTGHHSAMVFNFVGKADVDATAVLNAPTGAGTTTSPAAPAVTEPQCSAAMLNIAVTSQDTQRLNNALNGGDLINPATGSICGIYASYERLTVPTTTIGKSFSTLATASPFAMITLTLTPMAALGQSTATAYLSSPAHLVAGTAAGKATIKTPMRLGVAWAVAATASGVATASTPGVVVNYALRGEADGVGGVSGGPNINAALVASVHGLSLVVGNVTDITADWPVTHIPILHISGIVYDHTGAVVSGATVKLFRQRDDLLVGQTTSASDGSYSFNRDSTDPNNYYVVAYATAGATQIHGTSDRGLVPA